MDYIGIIIPFIGGLGMFIYGMQIMASGLENAAGNRMKSLLEALTRNKFLGVLLGAFITAVIQSSTATIVLTVALIGAGVYASHGYERSHKDGVENTLKLLAAYCK